MIEMWNKRYGQDQFAYGQSPNEFFKDTLESLKIEGKILLPAEGEGRNAVYAAQKGLSVYASDQSSEGQKKAFLLAEKYGVGIEYDVCDIQELNFEPGFFDACALIYAHLPPPVASKAYPIIHQSLKPGGYIILEGFSKNNLERRLKNPEIGGPDRLEMLYSVEEVEASFPDFETVYLEELEVNLTEGLYHNGRASVVRYVGRRK